MRLCALLLLIFTPLAAEKVCNKCERIRTFNKLHPGDFEYYDDYLKAKAKEDIEKNEEESKVEFPKD